MSLVIKIEKGGEIMEKVKCMICDTEMEEEEAVEEGDAVFCEDCYFEKKKRRC